MPRLIVERSIRRRQRGAGALIVVLVLFFIMALVAAYSGRNMILEQKTASNLYRSGQAFEAAEAGVDWALAMLNGGRINALCVPDASAATSFRQRYLDIDDATGSVAPRTYPDAGVNRPLSVQCVRAGAGGWSCSCPEAGEPSLTAPGGTDPAPAFRLMFVAAGSRPGVVTLRSQGCTRLSATCLNDQQVATGGDATVSVTTVVALKGALSTPPSAALTARRAVGVTGAMRLVNTDPATSGITAHSGEAIGTSSLQLDTLAGTPGAQSVVENDTALRDRPAAQMFNAYFGMTDALYREQPAAIELNCPGACNAAALRSTVQANPGRMLWLTGDVTLDSDGDIGSPASPVVMVVTGHLQSSTANARIHGLVYVRNTAWTTAGAGVVRGAVIADGSVGGAGTATVVFDPDILRRVRLASGSFVRVPGGWRDF